MSGVPRPALNSQFCILTSDVFAFAYTLGHLLFLCFFLDVSYGTSSGASPFGQSFSFPARSGRGCEFTYAARSNASCSVSVPGRSFGMLYLMNDAAVRSRAMLAPTLKLVGPHSGGPAGVPCPSMP